MCESPKGIDLLVERVISLWCERSPSGEINSALAWYDLAGNDRERAFRESVVARLIEVALDPRGLSTTASAVIAEIVR
ncbi:MAG: hypothetical protein D6751_12980 [Deltaproteobacteria bacterium]|nr:MAG: hypothetical protein D6751_12980 [Deltaproteobacteria bacterium]